MLGALCALGIARTGAAQEVAAPPEAVRPWSSPNAFLVTGAVLFGASYGASYTAYVGDSMKQVQCLNSQTGWGIFSCQHTADRLLPIPVAGPWMTLAGSQPDGARWTGAQQALFAADGVAQGVGVALLVYGVVRQLVPPRSPHVEAPGSAMTLRPGAGSAPMGLTAALTF
ncbi:MAG TPA: hypothetical protein VGL81_36755 [Polyangiaceae bacterium]